VSDPAILTLWNDYKAALAEVERLRAENAAARQLRYEWSAQMAAMRPVGDAARAYLIHGEDDGDLYYRLRDAVRALDGAQCCTNIDPHTPGGSNCR
jgi:hypothetical protein